MGCHVHSPDPNFQKPTLPLQIPHHRFGRLRVRAFEDKPSQSSADGTLTLSKECEATPRSRQESRFIAF